MKKNNKRERNRGKMRACERRGENGNKINDLHLGKRKKREKIVGVERWVVRLRADLASHP